MSRKPTGSIYASAGTWYLSVTLSGRRRHFAFAKGITEDEARLRQPVIVDLAVQLDRGGHTRQAELFCERAAQATPEKVGHLVDLMKGLLDGTMKPLKPAITTPVHDGMHPSMTVREFSENFWTNNELARRFRRQVKEIDHSMNIMRMRKHVFPVVFEGRTIGDTPLNEFTVAHGDFVKQQPSLPDGSVRHVAQCLHRLFKLAVYPACILDHTPFPPGWLPLKNDEKARTFLYPAEDAALMGFTDLPLVWRIFFGFCAREGLRKENAVTLEWPDLDLGLPRDGATVSLDITKNGRDGLWKLDPGSAEALRRWRRICPESQYVFPTEAVPRYRRDRAGLPMSVGKASDKLRDALFAAEQKRAQLYMRNENRLRLRHHDLRATFVTLSLAMDRSEEWVMRRTGHMSSNTLAIYKRHAKTVKELELGWLHPMHELIPELRPLGDGGRSKGHLRLVGGTDASRDGTREG